MIKVMAIERIEKTYGLPNCAISLDGWSVPSMLVEF
jgi:hypothetical protein